MIDQAQVQHVARLQPQHRPAIGPIVGRAIDLIGAQLHLCRARLQGDVQFAVAAAMLGRAGQGLHRRGGGRIDRRAEQVVERPGQGGSIARTGEGERQRRHPSPRLSRSETHNPAFSRAIEPHKS